MKACPNCHGLARNDGSEYSDVCAQWPHCVPPSPGEPTPIQIVNEALRRHRLNS